MKKIVTVMAVALVAVMTLSLFAACGYPNDPDKAKEKLEADGYKVTLTKNSGEDADIQATVTATKTNLTDFSIGDLTNAEKLKELYLEGIIITYYRTADLAKEHEDDITANLTAKQKEVAKVARQGSKLVVTYKLTGADAK